MKDIRPSMDLETLVGDHILSGCDCTTEQVHDWGEQYVSAGCLRFILDGVIYEAIEDPDDGYRSSLEGLHLANEGVDVQNVFTPVDVKCTYRKETKNDWSTRIDDVLEIRCAASGKTLIEVGTEDVDDYYPGCVLRFNPENLPS